MTKLIYEGGRPLHLYGNLRFSCLTPDMHARTCNYWVTVTSDSMALIAFHTQAGFLRWLERYGLSINSSLPPRGEHHCGRINGCYGRVYESADSFASCEGEAHAVLSNGSYYSGKLSFSRGFAIEHVPHFDNAPRLDYRASREAENPGYLSGC